MGSNLAQGETALLSFPAYAFFRFYGLNLIELANTAITNDSYHTLHPLEHNCLGPADPPPSARLSSTVAKSKSFLDPLGTLVTII